MKSLDLGLRWPALQALDWRATLRASAAFATRLGVPREVQRLEAVRRHQAHWHALDPSDWRLSLRELRARLHTQGWAGELQQEALGCVAAAAEQALGLSPFDAQLRAARALLAERLVEMATGEGKSLSVALAAAVAALAGVPVHAMTANDYLAGRDALAHQPLFDRLGLRVGVVKAGGTAEERRAAYRCDVTWCTAREVAFDLLRDRLDPALPRSELQRRSARLAGRAVAEPLLRGLRMAILDEADSLLIDEATTPLLIAEPLDDAAHRAACFQALALASGLSPKDHFRIDAEGHRVHWMPSGDARLAQLAHGLPGAWHNSRHRRDMVLAALEALHLLQRDRHYLVRHGGVELLDAVTGRSVPGRVWSRGLQTMVELKEGCTPSPTSLTRGQISFQSFFDRYTHLCGLSGSLRECRGELRRVYASRVVTIPLRRPCCRRVLPERLYVDAASRRRAIVVRVTALHMAGRPVLVGTDSVADSASLSAALTVAGIGHRVLDARHDTAESAIVAEAGQRSAVTVATRMAGRGTDIVLGPGVAALGGLHVLNAQDNASPRLDRQLLGRCARQGDPGSAETWRCLPSWSAGLPVPAAAWRHLAAGDGRLRLPALLVRAGAGHQQRDKQRRAARQRRRLMEQDQAWTSLFEAANDAD